jgi:hypothetical protein
MQQSDQLNDGVVGLITPVRGGPDQLDVPTVLGTGWYNVPGMMRRC